MLLSLKRLCEAEKRLILARKLFDGLDDKVRRAQVDETLAQLHLADNKIDLAERAILRAVEGLGNGGEDAHLAEVLSTHGVILCRLGRHREAKRVLERSNRMAENCGDREGAGRALLIVIEEMFEELDDAERLEIRDRLDMLLSHSQQRLTLERLRTCQERMAKSPGIKRLARAVNSQYPITQTFSWSPDTYEILRCCHFGLVPRRDETL